MTTSRSLTSLSSSSMARSHTGLSVPLKWPTNYCEKGAKRAVHLKKGKVVLNARITKDEIGRWLRGNTLGVRGKGR